MSAAWRRLHANQTLKFFETVSGKAVINEDGTVKVSIENSDLRTIEEFEQFGDSYCIDFGQNWYINNLKEKVELMKKELAQ